AIHCTPLNRLSLGASTCWTFSWSPSRSFSSRCRSATPSLAIGSEEACHGLRLFTRRPRDRGADDLPRLRAAQARAALKGRDHDRHRLDSNPHLLRHRRRAGAAARQLHDARIQRRTDVPFTGPPAGRSGALLDRRRRRATRAALGHLYGIHAVLPRRRIYYPLCTDALTLLP